MEPDELPQVSTVSLSEPPPPDSDLAEGLMPGAVLAERYEILRTIAVGGTATVYLAKHLLIDRPVAIKVLDATMTRDPKFVQRFLNEGRAVGSMGHPHIIESTDLGYLPDGAPFLVLEYLEGRNLQEEIDASGRLELGRALDIAVQTAAALAAAHGKGIVHRDLKSENVFLVQKIGMADHVKVLDFGVSKFSSAEAATEAGVIYGTADFLSPEQVGATNAVDARTDVYAMGVLLYQMLTGHLPFENHEFPAVLTAIVQDPPQPLTSWRDDLPAPVVSLVERCMQKRPEDRYQTIAELAAALSAMAEPAPISVPGPVSLSYRTSNAPSGAHSGAIPVAQRSEGILPPSGTSSHSVAPHTGTVQQASSSARWAVLGLAAVVALGAAVAAGRMMAPAPETVASGESIPEEVQLDVDAAGGKMVFRGREFVLPYSAPVRSSEERERIDVHTPDGGTRTIWVTLTQAQQVWIARPAETKP